MHTYCKTSKVHDVKFSEGNKERNSDTKYTLKYLVPENGEQWGWWVCRIN